MDDEELAERCRSIRNLCFWRDIRYVHDEISDNYRFMNLQVVVGLAQLERLDEFIERKSNGSILYGETEGSGGGTDPCCKDRICGKYLLGVWPCVKPGDTDE